MARVYTKIGDVFSVKIDAHSKKYFQLIAYDLNQLNSDVIRAFKRNYLLEENPNISVIINDEIDFYAHCVTKFGVKMNLWDKVGSTKDVGNIELALFRCTNDYGAKRGEEPIKVSEKWYVWRINDVGYTRVGRLHGSHRKAEIGVVVNPYDIVERIKTGNYSFVYPAFE